MGYCQRAGAWARSSIAVTHFSMQYNLTRRSKLSPNVSPQELQARQRVGRLKHEKNSARVHKAWDTRRRNQAEREQAVREALEDLEPRPQVAEIDFDDTPLHGEANDIHPGAEASSKPDDGQDRAIDGTGRPEPVEGAADGPNRHGSNEQSPSPPDPGAGPIPAENDNPLPEQHEADQEHLAEEVLPRFLVADVQSIASYRYAIQKIDEKIERLLPDFRVKKRAYLQLLGEVVPFDGTLTEMTHALNVDELDENQREHVYGPFWDAHDRLASLDRRRMATFDELDAYRFCFEHHLIDVLDDEDYDAVDDRESSLDSNGDSEGADGAERSIRPDDRSPGAMQGPLIRHQAMPRGQAGPNQEALSDRTIPHNIEIRRSVGLVADYRLALRKIDHKLGIAEAHYFESKAAFEQVLRVVLPVPGTFTELLNRLEKDDLDEDQMKTYDDFWQCSNGLDSLQKRRSKTANLLRILRYNLERALQRKYAHLRPVEDLKSTWTGFSASRSRDSYLDGPGNGPIAAEATSIDSGQRAPNQSSNNADGVVPHDLQQGQKEAANQLLLRHRAEWRRASWEFGEWRNGYRSRMQQRRKSQENGEVVISMDQFDHEYWRGWRELNTARVEAETRYKRALSEASKLNAVSLGSRQESRFAKEDPEIHARRIRRSAEYGLDMQDRARVARWADSLGPAVSPSRAVTPPKDSEDQVPRASSSDRDDCASVRAPPPAKGKIRGWHRHARDRWAEMRTSEQLPAPDGDTVLPEVEANVAVAEGQEPVVATADISYTRYLKRKWVDALTEGDGEDQYQVNRFEDWKQL